MKNAHIEKEYKIMIDELAYQKIMQDLKLEPFKQTNYYYDTKRDDCSMRIRQIGDQYLFTLKQKAPDFKYEYEFDIPSKSLDYPTVQEVLTKFEINDYQYLGEMITYRAVKSMQYGELCVDKSLYNGKVDYELEYELYDYQKDEYADFLVLLERYHIDFVIAKYTKLKRFLNSLEKN